MLRVYGCFVDRHDMLLVALAVVVCSLATVGSVTLVDHARRSEGRIRALWLGVAAMAGGVGIWATHFIAMLAFEPGLPSGYAIGLTACSLVAAVLFTGAGFALALDGRGPRGVVLGGAVLGLGIGAMHYGGMAAYRVAGRIDWDVGLVAVSVALGVALAAAALAVAETGWRCRQGLAALLLSAAICAHHFIGMGAVGIHPDPGVAVPASVLDGRTLAVAVALAGVLVVLFALLGLAADIRARNRSALEGDRMRSLADAAVEGLLICEGGAVAIVNASFAELSGFAPDDLALVPLSRLFPESAALAHVLAEPDCAEETELVTAGGAHVPVEVIAHPIVFAGRPHTAIAVRDLRARKLAEERIRFLAHHDALTGLPNRAWFGAALDDALAAAQRRGGTLAVLCLDLDRFKEVNDIFGHGAGDEMLKAVARKISGVLDGGEIAARLGGDEFAMLLPDAGAAAAEAKVKALLDAVARRAARTVSGPAIGISVGVALFPADGADAHALLSAADTALYRAKAEGRGTARFYEPGMGDAVRDRRRIEHDLRSAVARGELGLVYQPQMATGTGMTVGFEALLRWRHPERGFVSPALFVPIAEDSGAILPIGEWVLRTACAEAASWAAPLRVAVNVSAVQLHAPGFAELVEAVLRDTGIDPTRLELEITETALIRDIGRALAALRRLKALGVKVAMDDFGTGYSSLSNLRAFPFDRIKIDGSFVQSVDTNPQAAAIVRAILELGRGLDLSILAEGVETAAELGFLGAELCHEVQGYLLGRPAPIAQFEAVTRGDEMEAVTAAA
ncbi:bifunctional diguanylate cyclase/phosphodiesterase [Lichenibacterium dinghuense]|uniref:bifunctional diguanylate cyclase/phosphodiesterase n=1 Tax=Lichenibacterium dinghuense TaxID=2895977 RepID=UPI001F1CBB4E|nr:EAL domain-containing protein [Lichenibacterium sp. 6Y81]